ncbi:UNVERIFIED_CONTAM: hypothetical protein Sradi_0976000 [Sesamum radiatum]|uniref:Uncharacterized protein n=1 Tax=Sesamum radiatum TaxID=300843 RepID=A0AAW2V7F9_SESRA
MLTTSKEFEKKLLAETHPPPGDIGITFDGIGAFGNVKEPGGIGDATLAKANIILERTSDKASPCWGILLFAPRGSG